VSVRVPVKESPAVPFDAHPPAGAPGRQPMFNVPPVTLWLVGAITAMFVLVHALPGPWSITLQAWLSVIPLRLQDALGGPYGLGTVAAAATLLTYALIHVSMLHFLVNAGFLLAFGSFCERGLGRQRYLVLVAGSAVAAAVTQAAVDWGLPIIVYGASGIVSGCMGGMVRLVLAGGHPERQRFVLSFVGALFVLNLLVGLLGSAVLPLDAEVAWEAHIGGFIAGTLLAAPPRRARYG
jgi:membrane associated rhomboid family serine protease